jgi:hypothetical protein
MMAARQAPLFDRRRISNLLRAQLGRPLLDEPSAAEGFAGIVEKFATPDAVGPVWVRQFVEGSSIMGDRTADQWQTDAYGQVDAWLIAMGLK